MDRTVDQSSDTTEVEIPHPLALSRVGSMLGAMLEEIRQGSLDQSGRRLLRGTFERAFDETRRLVPEDQRHELDRVIPPLDGALVSDADLRLAYTQLVGWLQGIFAGAQLAGVVEESRMFSRHADSARREHTLATAGAMGVRP